VYVRPTARKEIQMAEQTKKPKTVEITIDEREYMVAEGEMTVAEILAVVDKDASSYYLVEIKGKKEREKYTDPYQSVKIHKARKFVTVFNGETPVS
jgi:hypothetical protein